MTTRRRVVEAHLDEILAQDTIEKCVFDKLDLSRREIEDKKFSDCSFEEVNFAYAKLNATEFNKCNLSNVVMKGTNLFSTSFIESKLMGVAVKDALQTTATTFKHCILDYASFQGLDLHGYDFSHSSCIETDFSYCNLEQVNFMNSDLSNASFAYTKMLMTDFRGAMITGMQLGDHLTGTIFNQHQVNILVEQLGITLIDETEDAQRK